MTLHNDTFLRALMREHTDFTPVWLMRQAGRYLPEYCATRSKAGSFMGLAKNPDYATEVTLQPIDRYGIDAAILFSDILTVPDAMGLGLSFVQGEGPVFAHPVQDEAAVKALAVPDIEDKLGYVTAAVRSIRRALDNRVPLIGFSGSPFTLACYMVEGRGAVADYLNAQIAAGAQAVQIFDTWGGMLADGDFQRFSLAATKKVVSRLTREADGAKVPVIVFTKGGGEWIEEIAACGCDAVGLDWTTNLARARRVTEDRVALQGNMDPLALFGDEKTIRSEVRRVIDAFGPVGMGGHVFNLGHGINQFTPIENVQILVDEVHEYSRHQHI